MNSSCIKPAFANHYAYQSTYLNELIAQFSDGLVLKRVLFLAIAVIARCMH